MNIEELKEENEALAIENERLINLITGKNADDFNPGELTKKVPSDAIKNRIAGFDKMMWHLQKEKQINNILLSACEFYGDFLLWDQDRFLCLSYLGRNDLEETEYSRFTPGKRAREAIMKVKNLRGQND